jgi:hypothetical protein
MRLAEKMRTTFAPRLTPPAEHALLVVLLVLTTLFVSGCASVSPETADPCVSFEPITTTVSEQRALSEETMGQIDGHNATWLELCE